ncbi:unnamed protein product [Parajaminaea phylloscopi]
MGNDGGSIARRGELVKVKRNDAGVKGGQVNKRIQWTTCRLSGKPLREPVVADALGRLYNKEALVSYLIERKVNEAKGQSDGDAAMSHIRGLKDVTLLRLHPNPDYMRSSPSSSTPSQAPRPHEDDESAPVPFVCPLTNKSMNGSARFVYIQTSGVVISESGLKSVLDASVTPVATVACPVTSTPFQPGWLVVKADTAEEKLKVAAESEDISGVGQVVPLNPPALEEQVLRGCLSAAKAAGKKNKRARGPTQGSDATADEDVKKRDGEKRRKHNGDRDGAVPANGTMPSRSGPPQQPSAPSATSTIAELASREARRQEGSISANTLKTIYGTASSASRG